MYADLCRDAVRTDGRSEYLHLPGHCNRPIRYLELNLPTTVQDDRPDVVDAASMTNRPDPHAGIALQYLHGTSTRTLYVCLREGVSDAQYPCDISVIHLGVHASLLGTKAEVDLCNFLEKE